MRITFSIPIIILTGLLLSTEASAQESLINEMLIAEESVVEILAENRGVLTSSGANAAINPKTGQIIVRQNLKSASYERFGAGVIIHSSGVIATNAHIVHNAQRIVVYLNDKTAVSARVARLANDIDLALLVIQPPWPLPALEIANSDLLTLGEEIVTIGSSKLLNKTISGGVISGLGQNRSAKAQGFTRNDLIQTTFNLYEGDSGGPLFNREGQLIGLMTAKETAIDHSSFAIPSNQIQIHLTELMRNIKTALPR